MLAHPSVTSLRGLKLALCERQHSSGAPLPEWNFGHGRCPTRTGDLLLVRREHLLRSTAACRSGRPASGDSLVAAAFCRGLSLLQRLQMLAPAFTRRSSASVGGTAEDARRHMTAGVF